MRGTGSGLVSGSRDGLASGSRSGLASRSRGGMVASTSGSGVVKEESEARATLVEAGGDEEDEGKEVDDAKTDSRLGDPD